MSKADEITKNMDMIHGPGGRRSIGKTSTPGMTEFCEHCGSEKVHLTFRHPETKVQVVRAIIAAGRESCVDSEGDTSEPDL